MRWNPVGSLSYRCTEDILRIRVLLMSVSYDRITLRSRCATCRVGTLLWSIFFGSLHPTLHFFICFSVFRHSFRNFFVGTTHRSILRLRSHVPTNALQHLRQTPLIGISFVTDLVLR